MLVRFCFSLLYLVTMFTLFVFSRMDFGPAVLLVQFSAEFTPWWSYLLSKLLFETNWPKYLANNDG